MTTDEKPGIETTEAFAGLAGVMSSLTALFTSTDWRVSLAAVIVFGAVVCTYIWSRAQVKSVRPTV